MLAKEKEMVTCPKCGHEQPEDSQFCNFCGVKLEPSKEKKTRKKAMHVETGVCPKCGNINPAAAEFCFKCGKRLKRATILLQDLVVLNLAGALYVLIAIVFNALIRSSIILLTLYAAPGIIGLYMTYIYQKQKVKSWTKYLGLAVPTLGMIGTGLMFLLGLTLQGVIGPAWIIFVILLWRSWANRYNL